jgi:uncharacterized protein
MVFSTLVSAALNIQENRVAAAMKLFDEGNTIPFIARYRKDVTDDLDEVQLRDIQQRYEYFKELQDRKETVLKSIEEQGKLSPELKSQIENCLDKVRLEDLYLPFKPKKRTRATVAREAGLEPLARIIEAQDLSLTNTDEEIARIFCSEEKGIASPKAAIQGALDILAEEISENAMIRQELRRRGEEEGILTAQVRKEFENQKTKFETYYDFKEKAARVPSHRVLAIRRGEKEKVLRYSIDIDDNAFVGWMCSKVIQNDSIWKPWLELCCKDSYERLLKPSMETEIRMAIRQKAEEEALSVFGKNLEDVLLAPPAGQKVVLALDPGLRSGCKVAVVDSTGKFLDHTVVYPHTQGAQARVDSKRVLRNLLNTHKVDVIAIGNGTASRETHAFAVESLEGVDKKPIVVVVSEAGASVYSASDIAREEFPDLDVTTRGAISIGRRLQDPLAELVKVDPKSIGVGQYQHDVNQSHLGKTLDQVVESCVNRVGVDINTASAPLLSYVAGISKNLATNIVKHRDSKGAFKSRQELMQVSGFGPKAFEQSAGFMRLHGGENPLDNSAVHPENYSLVEQIATDLGLAVPEVIGAADKLRSLDKSKYLNDKVGEHTLADILAELEKPGRDPRSEFRYAHFNEKIQDIQDLVTGSWMEGVVTNVTNFGAFVDIGVHQDGLVHISELSDQFVKDAKNELKVGDIVKCRVMAVDVEQKRIALSMKSEAGEGGAGKGRPGENRRGPGGHQGQGGRGPQDRGPKGPNINPTATLADLKKKLRGEDTKEVKPVKPTISLKALMKKGR